MRAFEALICSRETITAEDIADPPADAWIDDRRIKTS
jgi:hypothetical protein